MDLFGEPEAPAEETVESFVVPPEPEETFTHPRSMNLFVGNKEVEQKLLSSFSGERPPQGLIFAGPKGIGKATLAYRLAKYLLHTGVKDPSQNALFDDAPAAGGSLDVDPGAQAARLVSGGAHPDLMSVERAYDSAKNTYKASVEVDAVRKVTPFLRMTASNSGWRIVIVDDADTMNRSSQNALLKILEEPPANVLIILVTHRLGALIPTIRSRTQLLNFQPLDVASMSTLLERTEHTLSHQEQELLAHLSQGSFGQSIAYLEQGALGTLDQLSGLLKSYPDINWPEIHTLADGLGRPGQGDAYNIFASLLQRIFSDLALNKARGLGGAGLLIKNSALDALAKNSSLEQLLKICENLHTHFDRVNAANLDKRQGVLQAFSIITA